MKTGGKIMNNNWLKMLPAVWCPLELTVKPVVPFHGRRKIPSAGKPVCAADYLQYRLSRRTATKQVPTLKEALVKAGLKDGMTISTHHHFREGDLVANMVFDCASELGVKNLCWFPSASFSCHAYLLKYLDDGTISHIEGSMNGPLGRYCSEGKMKKTAVLRSHGGRYQAIQDGDVKIDIAVIGAGCADPFGNANGVNGPSASGSLGFALADAQYADKGDCCNR